MSKTPAAVKSDKYPPIEKCACCGAYARCSYMDAVAQKMQARQMCFSCSFWEDRCQENWLTIIDGHTYGPGNRTSGEMRGMAGRRFDIEYFDGRRVTTYDLWSGGEIPEPFRSRMQDNARFLGNAEKVMVGQTRCWNPCDNRQPRYPLPMHNPPIGRPLTDEEKAARNVLLPPI